MGRFKTIDMMFIDQLFDMGSGYVLNFSDRTMAEFFASELHIDIDDPAYAKNGTSKAKRLRCFLQNADTRSVVRALRALWEYREALRLGAAQEETIVNPKPRLDALISRLSGSAPPPEDPPAAAARGMPGASHIEQLRADLMAVSRLEPQQRGFAFEKFLKRLFDAYGLEGRDPFRLRGEQIDGSFVLANDIYLLEAKWQGSPIGAGDLHAFHGKLEGKAAWARGLFISNSGFSEDGLHAFGRGKRVICMDGLDLYDTLDRGLSLTEILLGKVRLAAETGEPFRRVRDLHPR